MNCPPGRPFKPPSLAWRINWPIGRVFRLTGMLAAPITMFLQAIALQDTNDDPKRQQNMSYKGILNDHWQLNRSKEKPNYVVTEHMEHLNKQYSATVLFDGVEYKSQINQFAKKKAEQEAAKTACMRLNLCEKEKTRPIEQRPSWQVASHPNDTSSSPIWMSDEEERLGKAERGPDSFFQHQLQVEPIYFDFEHDKIEDHELLRPTFKKMKRKIEDKGKNEVVEEMSDKEPVIAAKHEEVSGKAYKSLLNELAQKIGCQKPVYRTIYLLGPDKLLKFHGKVEFRGKTYKSEEIATQKKTAENGAAKACLIALEMQKEIENDLVAASSRTHSLVDITSKEPQRMELEQQEKQSHTRKDSKMPNYKGLLDEHLMQRGLTQASYALTIADVDGLLTVTCNFESKQVQCRSTLKKTKDLEQDCAKAALISLGIRDPDKVLLIKSGSMAKKRRSSSAGHEKAASSQMNSGEPSLSFEKLKDDPQMFDFQYSTRKSEMMERERRLLSNDTYDYDDGQDPLSIWDHGEPEVSGTPVSKMTDLSVCEDWPERSNVVVVGNSEFSIPLQCPGNTKELICHKEEKRVRLRPGANIRGMVCKFLLKGNHIYLRGKSCEEIIYPIKPLPALISSGVVFIHCNPALKDPVQVLLKRYVTSPAFIHVSASLAQWFRRYFSGRPMKLDVNQIVKHIEFWLHSEVKLLSEMREDSMKELFTQWRFKDSWSRVFRSHVPEDLVKLKKHCEWELQRRYINRKKSEENFKPWNPPKGNFKHRLLTTGIFLEDSIECAFRELKKETGLVVSPSEIAKCPFVDMENLEHENFNPHKGDFVRYYLYLNRIGGSRRRYGEGAPSSLEVENWYVQPDDNVEERGLKRKLNNVDEDDTDIKRLKRDDDLEDGDKDERKTQADDVIYFGLSPVQTKKHEECVWMSMEQALESSPVLQRIAVTKEFQTLMKSARVSGTRHGNKQL